MKCSFRASGTFALVGAALVPLLFGLCSESVRGAAPATDVSEHEARPAGAATSRGSIDNRDAFSHPSGGISLEGEGRFKVGNAIFRRLWVAAPSSTTSVDGLGPLYNARGCQNCHLKDGRGRPPAANFPDEVAISMFLRLSIPPQTAEDERLLGEGRVTVIPEPTYGGQLQNSAVTGLASEGQMKITYQDAPVALADGRVVTLRAPQYAITDLANGPMHPDVMLSPRVAPPMIGLGLLEAVPEADIRAIAAAQAAQGGGISGHTNEVWSLELGRLAMGRFGWKAGAATIRDQSAGAASGDMGLSTPLMPDPAGDCTAAQTLCKSAPNGNSPGPNGVELSAELLDFVTFYSQNLAVPARRGASDPDVLRGRGLFYAAGCAGCHVPSLKTGDAPGQPHLSGQTIWPYTDLLLHDMGDGLADGRPEGRASGREWRTAPLWGIGLTQVVSGHTFLLHDGRARGIEEAILWHGGEGKAARDAFAALSKDEREALIKFVNSL